MTDELVHIPKVFDGGAHFGYACPLCAAVLTKGFGREHASYKKTLCHMSTVHYEWWCENWGRCRIQEPGSSEWIVRHYVKGKGDQSAAP